MELANREDEGTTTLTRSGARSSTTSRIVALLASLALAFTLLGTAGCTSKTAPASDSAADTAAIAESHLTFRNNRALEQHFEKHGDEVGCSTEEDYLAAANAVIANPAALHKLEAEDGDDVYFLEDTGEFVVVSPQGYIRTYFITDRDYYNRQ